MKSSLLSVAAVSGLAVGSFAFAAPDAPRAKGENIRAEAFGPTVTRKLPFKSPDKMRDLHQQQGLSHSVARLWNEMLLHAIRNDFARPTVHARNLYHHSAAMWDAWSAYDGPGSDQVFHQEKLAAPGDVQAAREEAISYA